MRDLIEVLHIVPLGVGYGKMNAIKIINSSFQLLNPMNIVNIMLGD